MRRASALRRFRITSPEHGETLGILLVSGVFVYLVVVGLMTPRYQEDVAVLEARLHQEWEAFEAQMRPFQDRVAEEPGRLNAVGKPLGKWADAMAQCEQKDAGPR